MVDLKQFNELPDELKLKIWEFAVPARIVEVAEPCDPDILPEEDLRKAWLLNRKYPTMAHVCYDARNLALAKTELAGNTFEPDMLDPRWWWKTTEIIHFNCPEEFPFQSKKTREIEERLIDLTVAPLLGKKVSFSADVLHPFLRFRHCPIPRILIWDVFTSLESCIVSLRTILIRATNEQARARGLFGNGEEPAKLVDPFDDALIDRYRALWNDTEHNEDTDRSATSFFESIGTPSFHFRTERWFSEVAIKFLEYKYIESESAVPPPGLLDVLVKLSHWPRFRHDPEAQEFLDAFPVIELRIMFRLCPPARADVEHVIT
jgi:hypothetical protein